MPRFVFWNMAGVTSPEKVATLAREVDADVVILAECALTPFEILKPLNSHTERLYFSDPQPKTRITLLTRFQTDGSVLVDDFGHVSIRNYTFPLAGQILVVAVHLSSKTNLTGEEQAALSSRLVPRIRDAEGRVGHFQTVVIGDFNMNPFESGMISSESLHAVMDRRIAIRGGRIVQGECRNFFYNPMWNFFGDNGPHPPGTFFYASSTPHSFFWSMFDQVLIRPSLLTRLATDAVTIVTSIGGKSLLTKRGRPSNKVGSDHLPIVIHLSDLELEDL